MFIKEVASSLYPWDLADEGVESCVDTLMEHSRVNSVYLVGIMHKEKRPLTSLFYRHNPTRKYYIPEDSRIYYPMDEANFKNTPMKPLYSERDFLKKADWLEVLTKYARKNGLKTGAEISHTFFDSDVAKRDFPDTFQRDINGEILKRHFCSNNEKVREYMRAIFYDTVKNHDIDFIQTCMMLFHIGRPVEYPWFMEEDPANRLSPLLGAVRGGCFCEKCSAKAKEMGYDWDKMVEDLKDLAAVANAELHGDIARVQEQHLLLGSDLLESGFLLEHPSLFQWLDFRTRCITGLFKDLYSSVKEANKDIDFRYNTYLRHPELAGLSFRAVRDYLDSVRDSDYTEQKEAKDNFKRKRNTLMKDRLGIGFDKDLIAAIAPRPNATAEIIKRSLRVLSYYSVDGISLGHYDGSYTELLDAVREGMDEAGIVIKT